MLRLWMVGVALVLSVPAVHADDTNPCVRDAGGNYAYQPASKSWDAGGHYQAQATACILRPIREAWAVLHNQQLMIWSGVSSSSFTVRRDVPADSTHFYEVNYVVHDFISVNWTMNWIHGVLSGTIRDPKDVVVKYVKVTGTSFIPYWQGSIELKEVAPGVTAAYVQNGIHASRENQQDCETTARELLEKLRTGAPNWAPITPADGS